MILDRINRLENLRFLLYLSLGRRCAGRWSWGYSVAPFEVDLIRKIDKELEGLWRERREERAGEALKIVSFWWGLPRGDIAPLARELPI